MVFQNKKTSSAAPSFPSGRSEAAWRKKGRKDRRKGTPPHRYQTNIPITPELEKEICELYSQGWSTIKLAERFKLDRFKTIKKILIKNKTPIRKRTDKIYHLENNFKKCKEVQDEETNNNITAPVAISN